MLTSLFAPRRGRPCWPVIRDCMSEEGVLNELGRPPTSQALSETWARVNRNWAAREERRARLADKPEISARLVHWPAQQRAQAQLQPQARPAIVDSEETAWQKLQRERREKEYSDILGGIGSSTRGKSEH